MELTCSAEPADGFLDLVLVEANERHKLVSLLHRRLAGKVTSPLLKTRRVRRVRISIGLHEIRLDDDVVWPPVRRSSDNRKRWANASIEVVPGALLCLLPAESLKHAMAS